MVALTGIECANTRPGWVELSLTCSKYVELVRAADRKSRHRRLTLSLGCHSELFRLNGGSLPLLALATRNGDGKTTLKFTECGRDSHPRSPRPENAPPRSATEERITSRLPEMPARTPANGYL